MRITYYITVISSVKGGIPKYDVYEIIDCSILDLVIEDLLKDGYALDDIVITPKVVKE